MEVLSMPDGSSALLSNPPCEQQADTNPELSAKNVPDTRMSELPEPVPVPSPAPPPFTWHDRICLLLVTGFGVGLIHFAPGTWGTVVGIVLYLPTTGLPEPWKTLVLAVLILAVCALNIGLGEWCERYFGGKDPQRVVLDEIAGMLLTLALFRGEGQLLPVLLWSFPLFRLFDITKLPPARQAEKLPKGWGVLTDDLVSACYAAALLWGVWFLKPAWFGVANP
jgi:phosphatidylglycerophosphatase A